MNTEEKIPAPPIEPGDKFFKWLDNFWYHYKWHTLIAIFLIVVAAVGITQMTSRGTADVGVIYAGPRLLSLAEQRAVQSAVRQVMEDYNQDGKSVVEFVSLMLMSDEQIQAAYEKAAESGEDYFVNAQFMRDELKKFDNLIMAGDSLLCFLDPFLYKRVLDSGGFMPLTEIFDELPEGAIDECGILLSDTKFGQYFAGVNTLPADTVLCIRRIPTFSFIQGKKRAEAYHRDHIKLLRAIMAFEFPQGYTPGTTGEASEAPT